MLLPSEIESRAAIPSLRAMIARRLISIHGLNQQETARLLKVTQAAVSNYMRGTRGAAMNWEEVKELREYADKISTMIMSNSEEVEILNKFHEAVLLARKNRFLCDIHQKLEPNYDVQGCHICDA